MFFAFTIEEINKQFKDFLSENKICPGNYIDIKLYKIDSIYQLIFVFAKVLKN